MKRTILLLALLTSFFVLSCGSGGSGGGAAGLSSAKAITAFSFANPAATGTVNESAKTISVTMPYGTNVMALVATFVTTGKSVTVNSVAQKYLGNVVAPVA